MKKYIFIYSILFFFFLNGMLFGQTTYTWTGSSSAEWATTGNWDQLSLPSGSSPVIIPQMATNNANITTSVTVGSLTLQNGATLTVANSGSLTVTSLTVRTNATIIIQGTATLSVTGITTNNGTITGGSGTLTFTGTVKNDNGATITSTTGSQTYSGDVHNFRNGHITGGSGTLTFNRSYDELLSHGNGMLTPSTSKTVFNSRTNLLKLTIAQNATVTAHNNLSVKQDLEVNTNGTLQLVGTGLLTITGATTNNGTITGGSGTLTFTGNYSGANGTLNASNGTTNFGNDVTFGTFVHNSGTVVFNGKKNQNLTTNGQSFNNIALQNNNTQITVTSGNLTVGGTLSTASNTTLTLNTHTLSVTGATTNNGTITGGSGTLTFTGAVTNYGGRITGGSRTLTFTGKYDEFHAMYPGGLTPSTSQTTFNSEAILNNLTIAQNATVTAHNNLSVKQDLEVNTNGTLQLVGTGLLTITGATTNNGTITGGSGTLTFTGNYSGANGTLTASRGTTTFGNNVTFGTFVHNSGTVVFKGVANASLTTSNQRFNDVFIDSTSTRTLTCTDNLTVVDFYAFNGTINLSTHTLTAQNVALFGSKYKENDQGWTNTTNTRHAYYSASQPNYLGTAQYQNQNLTFSSLQKPSAQITGNSPKIIVSSNFYANGVDLSNIALTIPNNDNSQPQINTGTSATQKQWGLLYAVVLNAAVTNCTARGGWVVASTGEKNNNVTKGTGANTNFNFKALEITSAKTVSDNIIKITFNQLIANRNSEIKKALARTDLNAGAICTHNGTIKFAKVFASIENALSGTLELSNDNIQTIYLKLDSETWNTDATGKSAGNADSTNRAGIHKTTIPDLSFLKGALYAANGKNMCVNYTRTDPFTGTTDGAKPVLVAVYTGQEEHTSGGGTSIPTHDAHNFIEFRYSEPVAIGNVSTIANNATNIQVTENLGKYISSGAGFELAGLGTFTNGKIKAGSRTISGTQTSTVKNDDPLTHALYRKFPLTKGDSAQDNPCRIRFSVAGYVNGQVNSNHFWGGFIDELQLPTGTVTPIANTIKDKATSPNNLDTTKTVTISTSSGQTNSLYGSWDTSPPVFAKHTLNTNTWADGSKTKEIIGGTSNASSPIVSHMEFHLHDNTPSYQASDATKWITSKGWDENTGTIPDTQGGIRESSLVGSQSGFSFRNKVQGKTTNIITFTNNILRKIFTKTYFQTTATNNNVAQDSLYFSIPLPNSTATQDDDFPLRTHFAIMYKQGSSANRTGGFVTDLAGNRLKSVNENNAFSVDASPPQIALTLAPVGTKDLLIMFSKAINTDDLDAITQSFNIQNASSLKINTSQRAKIVFDTADSTALAFKLNQNISFDNLKNAFIQVNNAKDIIDKNVQGVTIPNNARHTMSDFAVNVIEPLNVYDKTYLENASPGFQSLNLYGNNLAAVRLFDGSGEPGNTLIKTDKAFMQVKVKNAGQTIVPKLYISSNPTLESISKNFNKSSLLHSRLWLPRKLLPIANSANTNNVAISHNTGSASTLYNFTVNLTNPSLTKTNQLQFLFELQKNTGSGVTSIQIDHDRDNNTPTIPLYAIRLKNPNDLSSIDLWSFNLDTPKTQKGGVSIFNNVINTRSKEEVRLQISMSKAGALTIHILTLDGNIVKTLHNAVLSAGEHFFAWDGTNNAGDSVARGLYFVRIVGPNIDETRKIMTIKE